MNRHGLLDRGARALLAKGVRIMTKSYKLLFDQLAYVGPDASKKGSHADVLKALAFCFKAINTNAHDDPAAARRILSELERLSSEGERP
jgi:hypothetical protein